MLYVPYQLNKSLKRLGHHCETTYRKSVVCIDNVGMSINVNEMYCKHLLLILLGNQHTVLIIFCGCYSEIATLLYLKMFPATPVNPKLAFTFKFLDLLQSLLLECQVSVKDFVDALDILTDTPFITVRILMAAIFF